MRLARTVGQGRDNLDRVDLPGQLGQNRRLISGTRADLEHAVVRLDLERLAHEPDDVGLGDGLAVADRQGKIAVSVGPDGVGHEQMPRHARHGVEHARIHDVAAPQLIADHRRAR